MLIHLDPKKRDTSPLEQALSLLYKRKPELFDDRYGATPQEKLPKLTRLAQLNERSVILLYAVLIFDYIINAFRKAAGKSGNLDKSSTELTTDSKADRVTGEVAL